MSRSRSPSRSPRSMSSRSRSGSRSRSSRRSSYSRSRSPRRRRYSRSRSPRSRSRSPRSRSRTPPPTKLHVGNLTRNVTEAHLEEIFEPYGKITRVDLALDLRRGGVPTGNAYVSFSSKNDAEKAIDYMDGGQIDGNRISVAMTLPPTRRSPPRRYGGGRFRGGYRPRGGYRGGYNRGYRRRSRSPYRRSRSRSPIRRRRSPSNSRSRSPRR